MGVESSAKSSVTAVIVTFNSGDVLAECLDSLLAATVSSIIVVDNLSTDETISIATARPQVQLVVSADNRGFAAANNRGLALTKTPFVLFINPDTLVTPPDAIQGLIEFMTAHPQAAAAAPRLRWPNGAIQPYAFGSDPTPAYIIRRALYRHLLRRPMHDWQSAEAQQVDWVSGACLLARTGALKEIGGWDESFFMYFEDNDLCRRLRLAGWQVWHAPLASIVHKGGQADYADSQRRRAYYAGLLHYLRKHVHPLAAAALGIFIRPYLWLTERTHAAP